MIQAQNESNRRMIQAQNEFCKQGLSTIMDGIANLRMQHTSQTTITASSTAVPDVANHVAARAELRDMVPPMPYPKMRDVVIAVMNQALDQYGDKVQQDLDARVTARQPKGRRHAESSSASYNHIHQTGTHRGLKHLQKQATMPSMIQTVTEMEPTDVGSSQEEAYTSTAAAPYAGKSQGYPSGQHKCFVSGSRQQVRTIFGTVQCKWKTYKLHPIGKDCDDDSELDEDSFEHQLRFHLRPALWILRLGFTQGFRFTQSKSIQGWKYHLDTYRAVPDDAEIFGYCRSGDVDQVRKLLSEGRASVWDTNSQGDTPLHVSFFLVDMHTRVTN